MLLICAHDAVRLVGCERGEVFGPLLRACACVREARLASCVVSMCPHTLRDGTGLCFMQSSVNVCNSLPNTDRDIAGAQEVRETFAYLAKHLEENPAERKAWSQETTKLLGSADILVHPSAHQFGEPCAVLTALRLFYIMLNKGASAPLPSIRMMCNDLWARRAMVTFMSDLRALGPKPTVDEMQCCLQESLTKPSSVEVLLEASQDVFDQQQLKDILSETALDTFLVFDAVQHLADLIGDPCLVVLQPTTFRSSTLHDKAMLVLQMLPEEEPVGPLRIVCPFWVPGHFLAVWCDLVAASRMVHSLFSDARVTPYWRICFPMLECVPGVSDRE